MFPFLVTSENLHRTNADTQCKKCMRHGIKYHGTQATAFDGIQIWNQIKLYSFHGIWQYQRMNRQDNDQNDQYTHHDFHDFLHTALQTKRTDTKCNENCQNHPTNHCPGRSQHVRKCCSYFIRRHRCQCPAGTAVNIKQHPAAYHCVKHHQQVVAENRKPFEMIPFCAFRFQFFISFGYTETAASSDCKLTDQNRQSKNCQKHQIDQNERSTSILSTNVWKLPYISKSNRTPG